MNHSALVTRLSQQVSATYARNHFKEVSEKVTLEGICVIVRKSKPVMVVLSMEEFEKMHSAQKKYEDYKKKLRTPAKKISLEELKALRKNSVFEKHAGTIKNMWHGLSSVEVAKKWTDYVD